MAKLITVFGATGQQGNPIARALLESAFKVRAVTRNPNSEKAIALKAAGAEVVKGDLNDVPSVEAAIQGAYGVFYVTNYWGLLQEDQATASEKEVAQGKAVADVCKKAGVKHVVFSGLELVREIIGVPCPHFDNKGAVERYLDEIGVPNTSVRYAGYYENFATELFLQKQDDGSYTHTSPMDGPMDAVSVADGGEVVASIFKSPDEFIGKKIGLSGDKKTFDEYLAILSKITGKTYKFNKVTTEEYAKFPFPAAGDIAAMFEFYSRGNPDRDIALTKRLNPKAQTFEEWVTKNKDKF